MFFAQAVQTTDMMSAFNIMGQNLSVRLFDVGMAIYIDYLGPLALDFARTVFPLILMAELMFVGFRIIMKESFVQQFLRLILITVINATIIYSQYPQQLLISGMISMERTGRTVAQSMITSQNIVPSTVAQEIAAEPTPSGVSQPTLIGSTAAQNAEAMYSPSGAQVYNPVVTAWAAWIGSPTGSNAANFRYSPLYFHQVLFAGQVIGGNGGTTGSDPLLKILQTWSSNQATQPSLNNPASAANGNPTSLFAHIMDALSKNAVSLGALMLAFFAPMQFLMLANALAAMMLAGLMMPGITAGTILGASYLTFFITLAFGVSVVPFAFFRTLEKSWNKWLRVLLGMALVPFIYYIFGAIGFIFSVDIYDVMFGSSVSNIGPMGTILATTFNYTVSEALMMQSGVANLSSGTTTSAIDQWVQQLLSYLTFLMQFFAQNSMGAAITTAFISMGCTFPAIALRVASNWESGFAEPGIMDQLQGSLSQMQGTISKSFNTGMQQGMQTAGAMIGRAL